MKTEYKLDTKKGQKVYRIEINIPYGERQDSHTLYKEGVFIKELKIVHQTRRKIALSDDYITVLDRQEKNERMDSYKHYLEQESICIKTKETYWPNGIFSSIYTIDEPDKVIKKLTSKISIKIKKEYGFLFNIDVYDIVDKYINNPLKIK